MDLHATHEVIVVGAGPAGIGVAAALRRVGLRPLCVDRAGVGASFRRWPEGMRLLTPSFTSNQFGLVDLNAITPDTSPALSLLEEHPTGEQYAAYLEMVTKLEEIDVVTGIEVVDVRPSADGALEVARHAGPVLRARTVVWAAGEAQYPRTTGFEGAHHTTPTITVRRWDALEGERLVVIGGYESGVDAAIQLVERGRQVTVLDRDEPWAVVDPDPSRALAPSTHGRLRSAYATGRLTLEPGVEVAGCHATDGTGVDVVARDGRRWSSDASPLLATGFVGSVHLIRDRFAHDEQGRVVVTEEADESTRVPGLHLTGPMLAHRGASFCFIYKFRQRFGVVARAIGARLGRDTAALEELRAPGFLLDDLSCCEDCAC